MTYDIYLNKATAPFCCVGYTSPFKNVQLGRRICGVICGERVGV
jgi:hypothetical protein